MAVAVSLAIAVASVYMVRAIDRIAARGSRRYRSWRLHKKIRRVAELSDSQIIRIWTFGPNGRPKLRSHDIAAMSGDAKRESERRRRLIEGDEPARRD